MAFRAKKKTKRSGLGRSAKFAPVRAYPAVLEEAERDPEGPGVLDLIHLHFQDKGYQARIIPGSDCVEIDFTHRMPWVKNMSMGVANHPATLRFYHNDGKIDLWIKKFYDGPTSDWMKGSSKSHWQDVVTLGHVADPGLISRLEAVIEVYLAGAATLQVWVKGTLR